MDTTELLECANQLFADDELTTVIGVSAFKAGDIMVLTEAPMPYTPPSFMDLFLVKLVVGPGNPGPVDAPSTSPGIGIEVWMPPKELWNGRIHNTGGLGGYDGGDHTAPDKVGWFYAGLTAGLEGAVSGSTDSGHSMYPSLAWAMNPDGSLATNLLVDLAHRAHNELALKTKALTTAYYGTAPKYCYYEGASTGGRHGFRLAQQYPEHYDGIIALLPTISFHEWILSDLYRKVVIQRDLDGVALTEEQMDVVSNAAIRAGDLVGEEHLGYVFDNDALHYDPVNDPEVVCPGDGGTNADPNCVTRAQARAISKMWYGPTRNGSVPDPMADTGTQVELGDRLWYGLARGTSLYVAYFTKLDERMRELLRGGDAGDGPSGDHAALMLEDSSIAGPSFRNATGNGQARWRELTYEQVAALFDRAREVDAKSFGNMSSDDPDLSAFRARGGKLLSWHGWNDESIAVQTSMRYFDRVVETMGGLEEVHPFFKFYAIPGGGHMSPQGTSNEHANPPVPEFGQMYRLLVDWVENDVDPGALELTSPQLDESPITYRIPPYPQKAVYTGGDPRVASSYSFS
jgi:hypothetical protein